MDGSDDRDFKDLTPATGCFSLTMVHRTTVRTINHDKQFTPQCAVWDVLFWPLLSIDTLCKECAKTGPHFQPFFFDELCPLLPHIFAHQHIFRRQGHLWPIFHLSWCLISRAKLNGACAAAHKDPPLSCVAILIGLQRGGGGFSFYTRYIHCS